MKNQELKVIEKVQSTASVVEIKLGDACNYRCKYCNLIYGNMQDSVTLEISDKFLEFINYLIEVNSRQNRQLTIRFWGGEPLIYFDTIKRVMEKLIMKLPYINYAIVTNGSLLTRERIDFLEMMNCVIAISHDGELTQQTRGRDILDEPEMLELVKSMKIRVFNMVTSAMTYDYIAVHDYIESKLGDDNFSLSTDFLMVYDDTPDELKNFDLDAYRDSLNKLRILTEFSIFNNIDSWYYKFLGRAIDTHIRYMLTINKSYIRDLPNGCGHMGNRIAIDLDGNIYPCQSSSNVIGSVVDYDEANYNYLMEYGDNWRLHEECINCKWQQLCKGVCSVMPGKPYCEHKKVWFETINLLIANIFNAMLDSEYKFD